ncbi:hypothetical protein B0H10DRAFT_1980868 [Mycena sp. CBHHK59/15]|nr:hypothetical protein B0H10DRAFT_1980868 [Mycena sp. CBHHK59/15]
MLVDLKCLIPKAAGEIRTSNILHTTTSSYYLRCKPLDSAHTMELCSNCDHHHALGVSEVLMRADGFSLQPHDILNLLNHPSNNPHWFPGIGRIGRDFAVKHAVRTRLAEAENSEFVRQNTDIDIPVPKVFLVFCIDYQTYIVSQLIEGTRLQDCWGMLSAAQKDIVVATIASYIRRLGIEASIIASWTSESAF